jgi:acetolactate decarboxylase
MMDMRMESSAITRLINKLASTCSVACFVLLVTSDMEAQDVIKNKTVDHSIHIVGAMSNVMHKGELFGTIDLDTISDKDHLVGLGPLENLAGEILILDGNAYKSTVVNDQEMRVTSTYSVKAPFFVYTHVEHWQDVMLPDSIKALPQLEHFLDQITQKFPRPFCFRVSAKVDSAVIHIVNLPPGTKVTSPEDAHLGTQEYIIRDKPVILIGFFSTEHQGIFTHHDSFTHIHLITADHKQMGHLTSIKFKPGSTRLLLPAL